MSGKFVSPFWAMTLVVGAPAKLAHAVPASVPCPIIHDQLVQALKASVKPSGGPSNGGFENHEWAAVVARDGAVCTVAFSGAVADDQWPGSRLIAAEKANTANALSLRQMALSTANLYASSQPVAHCIGLEATNPVNPVVAFAGQNSGLWHGHRSHGRQIASAAWWYSVAAWRSTTITASWAVLGSAAIHRVPTTMSLGGFGPHWGSTRCRRA